MSRFLHAGTVRLSVCVCEISFAVDLCPIVCNCPDVCVCVMHMCMLSASGLGQVHEFS